VGDAHVALIGGCRPRTVTTFRQATSVVATLVAVFGAWGAVRASEGLVWGVPGEGRGTPAADPQCVYFLSRRHEVVAIERRHGQVRWHVATGVSGEPTGGSRVLVAGGAIVAGDGQVLAFDPDSGRLLWRFRSSADDSPGSYLGTADDTRVFTGSSRGYLYAIDLASGVPLWSVRVARNTIVLPPIVAGAQVIAAFTTRASVASGGLVGVDRVTGREAWRRAFPAWTTPTLGTGAGSEPIAIGEEVSAASQDGTIYGFTSTTGALRWVIPGPATQPDGRSAPMQDTRPLAQSGPTLLAGSLTGQVIAYDLATRRERWRRQPVAASVAFALRADAGAVYVPYLSGHLVALDVATGAELWRHGGPDHGFGWAPLIDGDRIYAAGSAAGFFAWSRPRGRG
jgi:outer membrane protein assembly factor BamB